jgi:hypothetical protein
VNVKLLLLAGCDHDADRRCTMVVTPTGGSAVNYSYTYDVANRLMGIYQGSGGCNSTGSPAVDFSYDNADRRILLTLPNGVTQAYLSDRDSHVTSLTSKNGTRTLGTLTYGYGSDGRRTTMEGSLAAVNVPSPVSGNIFNADNEMTQFAGAGGLVLGYDFDGQLTSDRPNTYTWDARRHQKAVAALNTTAFVYDALGRMPRRFRVSRSPGRFSRNRPDPHSVL